MTKQGYETESSDVFLSRDLLELMGQVPLHDKHHLFSILEQHTDSVHAVAPGEIFDMEFNYDGQLQINVTYMTFASSDIKDFRALFFSSFRF
jgi:hypothetical protein